LAEKRQLPVYSLRLREAREAYGLSQRNLGIKAGLDEFVASTRINRYEKGVYQPNLHIQQKLAQALETPLAYFYADDDELAQLIRDF
jgi:transcriptional regulator with XRE-family HTH domain